MTDSLLIKNGIIITLGPHNRVLRNHSILCEDGVIKKIAPSSTFRPRPPSSPFSKRGKTNANPAHSRVIDADGKVVMPGFINAHMHFYSTMARGLIKAAPSKDFNQVLENLWWRLDKKLTLDDCYYSALVPLLDAVRHGTTTLIDHHASPGAIRGSLSRIANAVETVGLRASLCYEVSDRDGAKAAREGIEENCDFIGRCDLHSNQAATIWESPVSMEADRPRHGDAETRGRGVGRRDRAETTEPRPSGSGQDALLKALFGLHASFTLSDRTLEAAAEAGARLGAGFHVHVAEAESDQKQCMKKHRMRVVSRLLKAGILGPRTIAAHCVHVNNKETEILAETATAVAHNPQSNMNNAVGVARVLDMLKRGVLVGLGTDAMTVNMLEEMRCGIWAQRLANRNPSVAFGEIVSALLYGNAAIANRYWDCGLGELQAGNAADIILLDYLPPTPLDDTNYMGHVAFGLSQSCVDSTVVNGKVLMERKRLKVDIDEREVAARSAELAGGLWRRF
ncbi:MAG: amidohydrolase family protein [Planctomycetota bacterium]|nr:amidohydrolase family protein [Planctomycetota bacterium]